MKTVRIEADFSSWRDHARPLLQAGVHPSEVLWSDQNAAPDLFQGGAESERAVPHESPEEQLKIPREFFQLARLVACHSDARRWALLYQLTWRLTRGGESRLLRVESDQGVQQAMRWSAAVRRDRHKMKAFVRFRKTGTRNDREQFVAWFEPDHHIVELTAPFFARRFASMDWSILTPRRCAHWNGRELSFSPGVGKEAAPSSDELEDYWRQYYANIFNPARLKLDAMQSEMPKKYWKNLPEASLIAKLTADAASRTNTMIGQGPNQNRRHVSEKIPAGVPRSEPSGALESPEDALARVEDLPWEALQKAASACQACPLHENATQTVFGEGPLDAAIMLVGEQPGDQEDLVGRPFVGPAGRVLDKALAEASLERDSIYLTNTVKHFKWTPRGKHRLHAKPNAGEVHTCKPWVIAEALKVRPRVLVCLGSTAAKALIDPKFSVTQQRGEVQHCPLAPHVVATIHPSYLLRLPEADVKGDEHKRFVDDLALAASLARETTEKEQP